MAQRRFDNCYTCRFWIGQGARERGPKGSCRRFPPAVTPRSPEGAFPITLSTDWCGEWQRDSGLGPERRPESATAASAGQTEAETPTTAPAKPERALPERASPERTIYDDLTT